MSRSEDKARQRRRKAFLTALAEQLASPETPEVKQQYDRLLGLGLPDAEVRELMATTLAIYFWHTMRNDDYTYDNYVADMSKLPEIDWLDDDDSDRGQGA
jgi:hypothetical protein